ncbi:HRDC domain-containing protein [Bifidobacterium cuniculi]|uniref:Ribonuclease D n=1 Tax=Bifidobacterium cuniculi TaxID=1688 RepID=A0A087B3S7_9BIFI|nr:HRDC domain-containing protein [Bifidobacterium cuniculi]KFI65677.1 ribonuclease D [Bifidobacterium cuniculi]
MSAKPVLQREPREGVPDVIDTLEAYERYCERLARSDGPVAVDAERASGYRYGHDDWLIQFKREGAGIGLIDPHALGEQGVDWNLLNEALHGATWILHDATQDLPGFAQLGFEPSALFDTEIAARLLGLHRFGLAYVTEHYLGITLAKEHSAADWSYRPLPRDWRNYAALDVELLIELMDVMARDLKAHGKWQWAQEEFAHELRTGLRPRPPHPVPWLRISHITDIQSDRRALAVAKSLWEVRDRLARSYDIAPSLLLSDSAIIEAARRKPHNARQFRSIRCLNERVRMHLGNEQDKMFERYAPIQRKVKPSVWKRTIEEALAIPASQLPHMPDGQSDAARTNAPKSMKVWQRHHPDRFRRLQAARALVNQVSEDTHTPPDVLIKPQIIRNLCWTDEPGERDVASFLRQQGARDWQIGLLAESLTRVIMVRLP